MNTATHAVRQALDVAWLLAQAGARNLVGHWALAIFSVVIAFSAGNLCAMAQRGLRDTKPSRSCRARSSTL